MYPHERSLVKKLADAPFVIIGVNSDDSAETLRAAKEREDITWRSFFDGGGTDGPIATKWGVRGWPTVYVIDHEGVIRSTNGRGDALDTALDKLIPEARAAAASGGEETPEQD
jgi:peroxiredoxin